VTDPARPKCGHCGEQPVARQIPPAAPGARAVLVRLCACDWPSCGACKRPIRVAKTPSRCPHCGGDAFTKAAGK
jgi:DNA-directed RNA polymerase subunit RPC12/RpoP